ncbi:MAG: hypothetical protein HJJLKODD_01446 [Phycisphaerae bacterium]|nr:hypothetical protein [Phycisphaerae bacterium]
MLEILAAPFVACLILTGIHCYLGIHVVMRGVIFVDLSLAQVAALGAAIGAAIGYEVHSLPAYFCALGFTVFGAAVFSLARFQDRRIPQEAIIGIVYAVSNAVTFLILSKIAVDRDEIENLLEGRLLFVNWAEVWRIFLIYSSVALVHIFLRKKFFAISSDAADAQRLNIRLWDFIFYVTFGIVVTCSVQIAGVFLVFSFLVVPAVCAMIFFRSVGSRLIAGWGCGVLASIIGLAASAQWDLPTGAAVIASFGVILALCSLVYLLKQTFFKRITGARPIK